MKDYLCALVHNRYLKNILFNTAAYFMKRILRYNISSQRTTVVYIFMANGQLSLLFICLWSFQTNLVFLHFIKLKISKDVNHNFQTNHQYNK